MPSWAIHAADVGGGNDRENGVTKRKQVVSPHTSGCASATHIGGHCANGKPVDGTAITKAHATGDGLWPTHDEFRAIYSNDVGRLMCR